MARQPEMETSSTSKVQASQLPEAPRSVNLIPCDEELYCVPNKRRSFIGSIQTFEADVDYDKYFEEGTSDNKSSKFLNPQNSSEEYHADYEDEEDNFEEESVEEEILEDSDDEEAFNKFFERYLEVERLMQKKY
jgi:hypothetical protein